MPRKLILDISELEFQAAGPMSPRTDKDGAQRRDKDSGKPQWAVNLVVWSGDGDERSAETILVTVATDEPPSLRQMDFVDVTDLQCVPWVPNNGPSNVRIAYRAGSVTPVQAATVKAAS